MKKLLGLLGATSLVAVSSATVVACGDHGDKIKQNLTLVEGITIEDILTIADYRMFFDKEEGIFKDSYKDTTGLSGKLEGYKGKEIAKSERLKPLFNETKDAQLDFKTSKNFFTIQANKGESTFRIFLFERYSSKEFVISFKQLSTIELDAKSIF